MKQEFDLKTAFPLDSLHDQQISSLEYTDNGLLFHISKLSFWEPSSEAAGLYYMQHKNYTSCDIHFINVDDFSAKIGTLDRVKIKGTMLFDNEIMKYVSKHEYNIEIWDMRLGYRRVVIYGAFVKRNGHYGDRCILEVVAEKMEYLWA